MAFSSKQMLRGAAGEDMATLNNDSPYSVMFGPDKCFRDTNKVCGEKRGASLLHLHAS